MRSATGSYFSTGFAVGAFGAGAAVSAPLAGRALDRLGQRRLLPPLAIGFATALTALALSTEAFAWTFAVITVGMAAGNACGGVIIQAAGTRAAFLTAGGLGLTGAGFVALRLLAPRRRPELQVATQDYGASAATPTIRAAENRRPRPR